MVPQNYSEKGKKIFTGVRDHSYFYISSDKHNISSYIFAVYKVKKEIVSVPFVLVQPEIISFFFPL